MSRPGTAGLARQIKFKKKWGWGVGGGGVWGGLTDIMGASGLMVFDWKLVVKIESHKKTRSGE